RYLTAVPGAVQGTGADRQCCSLAMRLLWGFALPPAEVYGLLYDWGRKEDNVSDIGDYYPWSEEEIRRKVEWAMNEKYKGEVGNKLAKAEDEGAAGDKDGLTPFDRKARQYLDQINRQGRYPLYHAGRFYHYDGTRYVEDPELDQSIRTFFKDMKYGQSNNTIGNTTPIVKNLAHRSEHQYGPLPFYAGTGDFPPSVLAYHNGLLDLDAWVKGEVNLLPHTPQWCSAFCLPHDFNAGATCPR